MMNMFTEFQDKKILIWGYGREGKSTEAFLREAAPSAQVTCFDGPRDGFSAEEYDWVFKSPGIVMEEDDPKFTSQTQVFLEHFRDQTIGITGTKGKSTTSALLYLVLDRCLDRPVLLLGNIGLPCLDYVSRITEETVIVFEMSSHQLAHVTRSPHIALFLNLFEEHLDYYGTFEKYFRAKANIARYQQPGDILFLGENVPAVPTEAETVRVLPQDCPAYELSLKGEHNRWNAHFASLVAQRCFGCAEEDVRAALKAFEGLPHRLQLLGTVDGVDYYDDSISTIPEATIAALRAVPNAQTVIIGGMDRGIHYGLLTDFVRAHAEYRYIFAYASGKRIYGELADLPYCRYAEDLKEAAAAARQITEPGRACLLSPAAASYGYFKNFEERGDAFREIVFS